MKYTEQQEKALNSIKEFLCGDASVFVLTGYAGTGKTTLIKPIIEMASQEGRQSSLMAPTGRAAKILTDKSGIEATTIHRAIYTLSKIELQKGDENNESKIQYSFPLSQMCDARRPSAPLHPKASLIIIDEASMVGSRYSKEDLYLFGSGCLLNDVLTYACLDDGGKIIFVGDPAQLPPVGEARSCALDVDYLNEKGFSVVSAELTEVIRQASDSAILSNSIKLRKLIQSDIRTDLLLDRKKGEVEDIQCEEIAKKFCEVSPSPSLNGPVVVCFSNRSAASYNNEIRRIYYPGRESSIQVDDRLIIVGNNYSLENRTVLNGEFARVIKCEENLETQVGFVYVDDGQEKKRRVRFDLVFRDVTLLFADGSTACTKIFDSLLSSNQPNITYHEQCALMSNFRMRHEGLDPKSPEFIFALKNDPYYNAIRAKYGYAITCHKAQGGEWDTTFVDFSGRQGLSRDCLRWSYTAITRARRCIFGYGLHNIPTIVAKCNDVSSVSNVSEEYYPSDAVVPTGPYNNENDVASLKAKYWQVTDSLEGSGYHVSNIEHKSYREIYTVSDAEGNMYSFHALYNKAGILKPFTPAKPSVAPSMLLDLMNGGESLIFPFSYLPSNQNLSDLYSQVQSACDTCDIIITNVVEHLNNFKVMYYLQTDAYFAYLDVCVNKHGQITYISPRSELGKNDVKLQRLVEALK